MTTAIRAVIMLSVLVGLPAAWVYYGPLPPRAQRVVDRFVTAAKEAVDWDRAEGEPSGGSSSVVGIEAERVTVRPVAAATSPVQQTGSSEEGDLARRVEPLLAKLRELGVAEYALEPWGGARQLYRFHCEMPLAGNAQFTEQFEAIAADPRESVAQVVADVASWHASRTTAMLR